MGYVCAKEGVLISRNPDKIRGPDIMYISAEKLASEDFGDRFWQIQPDLIAEVISPNDFADEVRLKLRDYQAIKTRVVLLVHISAREIDVHTLDGTARVYREGDTLEFPEVLPGFRLEVAKVFQGLPGK